ncbi:phosphatidylserine decarboxylase [Aureivirga marina]|uniref:phosphatidylserine decarboxylase n=1 Tax=Aureivirga marina TaxID=1182451 RepID=UPI0018CBDB05|nr:phosphatidylserine decarboxylase [Aureivirga marina]
MFHREGIKSIVIAIFTVGIAILIIDKFVMHFWYNKVLALALLIGFVGVLYYYKIPKRRFHRDTHNFLAPFDGKITAIDKENSSPYFKDKKIKITVTRNIFDYRMFLYPVSGKIEKKEKATNEKVLTINDLYFIFDKTEDIVLYNESGDNVEQGEDAGFLKKCRKIDVYLPIDSKINVNLNSKIKGGQDSIASLS